MTLLSPLNFTRNVSKAMLAKPRCGILVVCALQRLIAQPLPCRAIKRDTRHQPPSDEPHMGVMIAAGLAMLDREKQMYVATKAGREWIAKLKAAGLIGDKL